MLTGQFPRRRVPCVGFEVERATARKLLVADNLAPLAAGEDKLSAEINRITSGEIAR